MQQFIGKYREQINGVLSGFDRLIFRGFAAAAELWFTSIPV
jgi:hypothetical protein